MEEGDVSKFFRGFDYYGRTVAVAPLRFRGFVSTEKRKECCKLYKWIHMEPDKDQVAF